MIKLIAILEDDFEAGIPLGYHLFNIRLAVEIKNKGKSGGARVIYFFVSEDKEIYLIHIFDKSDFENIPKNVILQMLKNVGLI